MIWYLIDAFNLEERDKNIICIKDLSKNKRKYFIMLIVVAIIFFIATAVIPILFDIHWIGSVMFVIYFATFMYFIKMVSKETEKEYGKNVADYKKDLDDLVHILRKEVFQLYTEKQINRLIEDCDQILPTLKRSKSVFKPFVTFFTAIIFPLVTLALNIIVNELSFDISLQVMIWIVLGPLYLISLYYLISPIIGGFLDSDYKKFRRLRDMLSDILLLYFMKE